MIRPRRRDVRVSKSGSPRKIRRVVSRWACPHEEHRRDIKCRGRTIGRRPRVRLPTFVRGWNSRMHCKFIPTSAFLCVSAKDGKTQTQLAFKQCVTLRQHHTRVESTRSSSNIHENASRRLMLLATGPNRPSQQTQAPGKMKAKMKTPVTQRHYMII